MSERAAKVIVQKYGGSSLADAEMIRTVAERICTAREAGADVVVAVSAMGEPGRGPQRPQRPWP